MSSFSYTPHRYIRTHTYIHTGITDGEIGDKEEIEDRDEEFRGLVMKNCGNNLHFSRTCKFPDFFHVLLNDFWGTSFATQSLIRKGYGHKNRKKYLCKFLFQVLIDIL